MSIRVPNSVDLENELQVMTKSHGINEPVDAAAVTWAFWNWIAKRAEKEQKKLRPEFGATSEKSVVYNQHGVVITAQEKTRSGSPDMAKLCTLVITSKGKMTVERFSELVDQSRKNATTYIEAGVVLAGSEGDDE